MAERDKDTLESKLNRVEDPEARAELRRVYEQESERTGWAQAAETLGQALAKYGAARKGVTGLEMPSTDWERKYDRILNRYSTDLRDLAGREAERRRLSEREADIAAAQKRHEEKLAAEREIAQTRADKEAAEKAAEAERQRLRGEALGIQSELQTSAKREGSRIQEVQKYLSKFRNKDNEVRSSQLDDKDEVDAALAKLAEKGITPTREEAAELAEAKAPKYKPWDDYDPNKALEVLEKIVSRAERGVTEKEIEAARLEPAARGLPAARTGERGGSRTEQPQISEQDREAVKWLQANPNHPDAPGVRRGLQSRGVIGSN